LAHSGGRPTGNNISGDPELSNSQGSIFDAVLLTHLAKLGGEARTFRIKQPIFAQGDDARKVMYVQEGVVKISVVNASGKIAVVSILGCGDFFGETCLSGESTYRATAIAITPATVIAIDRNEMIRELHRDHEFSDRFIAYTLARKIRVEGDLVDQLFNSSEKRLVRTLLLLARTRVDGVSRGVFPKISQKILAEIIGTTRSRVNLFIKRFRQLGYIQRGREIRVNDSLREFVLNE
jgi:CRP/FNR family cyclic AMP-dependent transcriptional regulator